MITGTLLAYIAGIQTTYNLGEDKNLLVSKLGVQTSRVLWEDPGYGTQEARAPITPNFS